MLRRTVVAQRWPWTKHGPRKAETWKWQLLNHVPKPKSWRDPRVWNRAKTEMKSFEAPQWDVWANRARSEDMDEALQPFMDMPKTLQDRRYDVPWWANPFGAWYLQNILAVELLKLPSRTRAEKIALYRKTYAQVSNTPGSPDAPKSEALTDDDTLIKRQVADRWRRLELGDRDKGHPCSYTDYIQFLNEWFKSLDEEGMQRLREHFDKKVRPYLAVMSHADVAWLEARTQNVIEDPAIERRAAMMTSLGTPEFYDMAQRLRYEINEDYKVRDEVGPELFALWSKAPERWPPERLAKMYGLDYTLVRKILVWHHFKACYDSCVEPDWSLPKRLFSLEWIRDVRAREKGKMYGRMRFAEKKASFLSDASLFKDYLNRREATYGNVGEMDDPYRFLQTEDDVEAYWGDNYDMYRRLFPEMVGRSGEPVVQYAPMPNWLGPYRSHVQKSRWNWLFAEIGVNVGHEPLKKLELDPTNEKRRRFIVRQPDGTMRSAKMSEMRAFYWKEQWADFRFWVPYMPWGIGDTDAALAFEHQTHDTADADTARLKRMSTRPVKWFYESHYTQSGEYAEMMPERHQSTQNRTITNPKIVNSPVRQQKTHSPGKILSVMPSDE
jgi:hypothetical protein